jgi:hypothetical protein
MAVIETRASPGGPLLPSDEEFARLQETDGSVFGYEVGESFVPELFPGLTVVLRV